MIKNKIYGKKSDTMHGGEKPTHISCEFGEIAPLVVMSGDPLRAKYIARKYLTNVSLVSKVRNMLVFTGEYNGKKITVMGHGMGMPSMSIYAYELFHFYGVEKVIRIGTCGAVKPFVEVGDEIVASSCYTESNFAYQYDGGTNPLVEVDKELTENILTVANTKGHAVHYGNIITYDVFGPYVNVDALLSKVPASVDPIGEEMEAFALAYIAKKMNKKAAIIATAVDSRFSTKVMSIEEREKTLDEMIMLALDAIII